MTGRHITEGRAERAIAVDLGIVSSSSVWENTDVSYDTAIGGLPFFYAISDARPYIRQTAPFRKEQFDNGSEPGEQSLTGWWLRSQSSFHNGSGINFYDPSAGETVLYRFNDSKGVNVWTKGEVTLLKSMTQSHETTGDITANGRPQQMLRSIEWTTGGTTYDGVLMLDEYDVDKIDSNGNVTHFIDYTAGVNFRVYSICDDGTTAYWITNSVTKKEVYKKPLTGSAASTADVTLMFDEIGTISNATMEYVKNRIVMAADNKVYEFPTSAVAMPTPVYTHPSSSHTYTSITASGPAIYLAGYNGIQSTIEKFTLNTSGAMPTLTSAITAAELPTGEVVHAIKYYLGYMLIGTSKGIRVAAVSDQDGSLNYGPLIVETSQPVYQFAVRDRFAWATTGVNGEAGLTRIDLGNEIETLRFAYANDVFADGVTGKKTTACAFLDGTDRIAFCTNVGYTYLESASTLVPTGYIKTGNIRYNTLEPKNFRRIIGRGLFEYGSMAISTVVEDGTEYEHITYDTNIPAQEVSTTQPENAQEFVAFRFTLYRDATTSSLGPTFKGYQAKATIATPRQRVLRFPVFCYDVETDRFNVATGYEDRALARLRALEDAEANGDVLNWQDLTSGESRQVTIEQLSFTRLTPPDKRFSGFGGVIEVTLRTV
ncbi:MAG: hypothetical protein ACO3YZ_07445 [Candidatus Nanopelagicaceae bacterium]